LRATRAPPTASASSPTSGGILTYANLVLSPGRDSFYRAAAEAGVDSVLVADAPFFEAAPFAQAARAQGIEPVLIAAPNTPVERVGEIARMGGGYTYCVARAGVTGAGEQVAFGHEALFAALAEAGAPPPILGFGISAPDHVEAALKAGAAGIISGSAIVRLVEAHGADAPAAVRAFVAGMKAATRLACRSSAARLDRRA
jgi:tryptophan synthase alpha chain